jgi:hypothetical protein
VRGRGGMLKGYSGCNNSNTTDELQRINGNSVVEIFG